MSQKSKLHNIKKCILEFLNDGKEHNTFEIRQYVDSKKLYEEDNTGTIRMALFQLKNEIDSIVNPRKGIYYMKISEAKEKKTYREVNSKYDFSDFDVIESQTKKETKMVVSILADGTVNINDKLLKQFSDRKAEIKIKKDSTQLVLLKNGKNMVYLGKNGRQKNYILLERLKACNIKLPVYYTGIWDADEELWIGELTDTNPNRGRALKS